MNELIQYNGPTGLLVAGAILVVFVGIRLMAGGAFGKLDWILVATLATTIGVYGMPIVESKRRVENEQQLIKNLDTLRMSIAKYRQQHGGNPPVVVDGTFPQLLRPTNGKGLPGLSPKKFPYGPYLKGGVPTNPLTGVSIITVVDEFPKILPTGNRGWLYHTPTGQISADSAGFLDK